MATKKDFEIVWDTIKNNKNIENNYDAFKNVKNFITRFPDKTESIIIKNLLIDIYNKGFGSEELKNALNTPDKYKNFKIIKLVTYAPFANDDGKGMNYFYKTIQHDSDYFGEYYKFVKGVEWFLKENNACKVDDKIFDELSHFAKENRYAFGTSKSKYDDYYTELSRLRMMCNGNYPDDFKEFKTGIEFDYRYNGITSWDINDVIRDYKSSKTGIVGEYDAARVIIPPNNIFVAKELGNGFGYDYFSLFTHNLGSIEILYEVKSTLNLDGDDFFYLSDNEYDVLMDTIDKPNTQYVVVRMYVDINKDEMYDYKILDYNKDMEAFTSNDLKTIYKLDKKAKKRTYRRNSKELLLK